MSQLKGLRLTTEPATPIITLEEAKSFLHVDNTTDDALITLYVDAATKQMQGHLHRALITQSWTLNMDNFYSVKDSVLDILGPGVHHLPVNYASSCDSLFLARMPIQSITTVKTTSINDAQSTVDSDVYDFDAETGRLFLKNGQVWPTDLRAFDAIEIIYVAGYGDAASDVPSPIRQGIYQQLGRMYEQRGECELSETIKCSVSDYELIDYMGFS